MSETLAEALSRHTAAAAPALVREEAGGRLRCLACGHRCLLGEGRAGICRVRYVEDGGLRVPRGYVGALQVDPIEKKPFFHAYPGTAALSFGMLGCDLHCAYCQNWVTSQALRDPLAVAPLRELGAADLVRLALDHGASVVASTYNEPLITAEWAVEVFEAARAAGLDCAFVSNGNATPEVLDFLRPLVSLYKVDLKGFDERGYRRLGGTLSNVLRSIEGLVARGFWVEIVTLVVPGFNDSEEELRGIARFLAGISRDIPWHVTGFHEDYKWTGCGDTQAETLLRAAAFGKEEGLRFVYAGNRPGRTGDWESTFCPGCGERLIHRVGFRVLENRLRDGVCPRCSASLPGVWAAPAACQGSSPGCPLPV
jgi:pyruvate formate lyase activating enzyme